MSEDQPVPKRKRSLQKGALLLLGILFVLAAGSSAFFYKKYQGAQAKGKVDEAALLRDVRRTVQLPDEKPTMVTIADKDKLSNKVLAASVDNQDILLIYNDAKRLVVYRPSTHKVIDMLRFADKSEVQPASSSAR
ncbi:MAG TPA: hypothetical protein VK694_04280 [Verrucomicrobiae bacterium]|nr:hypothetical protein [Verrucomicrobiae bacterium]